MKTVLSDNWSACLVALFCIAIWNGEIQAQPFTMTWLDIGEVHSRFSEGGAHIELETQNRSMEWPAILRHSGHYRGKAYWVGVKEWTDERGGKWPYRVVRSGPRTHTNTVIPVTTRLVAKFPYTTVLVDGLVSQKNPVVVDAVDPELPADRMLYHKYRTILGLETERWVYAYAHETHDDFHIVRRRMVNNGNTDGDDEIELPGQTLNDVLFFNAYRWVGRTQAAWVSSAASAWGKFGMIDVVGDGHQEYPVDFTAIYQWIGFDPHFASVNWDHLGSPMINANQWTTAGDTTGRLAGMSMQGRVVLHADESPSDRTYNPANQPHAIGWLNNDERLTTDGESEHDYYELGILTRQNPVFYSGGSLRNYPHFADLVEPDGEFWDPVYDASRGIAGGFAATMAYGPYQMAFGDTVNIVEAEGAAGLSYRAAKVVGEAFKNSGFDDDLRITFDANGNGIINETPWDYSVYKNGGESLIKNQWYLTARDSLFQMMYRARDVWDASNGFTQYPVLEPPKPPVQFEVKSGPEDISMSWVIIPGTEDPVQWEVYRVSDYVDNLPYALLATLPGTARSYVDTDVVRGKDYYFYVQAVGPENPVDERSIAGTPGGRPLRSGRYYTQTYAPASLLRRPGAQVGDFAIVPNPVNLSSDQSVRFVPNGDPTRARVEFLDIPGNCTISIYTEVGELVKRIEHTTGGGNASWDLLTSSRQSIVSGVYLVRVENKETGAAASKKLVVIK
ncbi:MAG: hypothetical protein AAF564_24590 [Bacteroidota bacterium]